jgi:hypothetical protein
MKIGKLTNNNMSHIENEKLLDSLWERYLELGGSVEELNEIHKLSEETQTSLIDKLKFQIDILELRKKGQEASKL